VTTSQRGAASWGLGVIIGVIILVVVGVAVVIGFLAPH
jgi:hypothetical protein